MREKRITAPAAEFVDAAMEQPELGSRVLALTVGGVLVATVWKKDSVLYFDAWAPFPQVPESVKQRQLGRLN